MSSPLAKHLAFAADGISTLFSPATEPYSHLSSTGQGWPNVPALLGSSFPPVEQVTEGHLTHILVFAYLTIQELEAWAVMVSIL